MKATDLRIGNLYLDEDNQVSKIEPDDFIKVSMLGEEFYKPIPLTEEWLAKLPKDLKYPKWIKFVHDLQNWYFALKGEELIYEV